MRSAERLGSQWSELQRLWTDEVAKRFATDYMQQIFEHARTADEVMNDLLEILRRQP